MAWALSGQAGRRALSTLGRSWGGTLSLGNDVEALTGNAWPPSWSRAWAGAAAPTGLETGTNVNLRDQSFLVTGSTSGIGLHTSTLLAQQGATVLVHGRARSKVQRTIRDLRTSTGNHRVFGYCYDLSSLEKTRALAAHVRKDLDSYFGGKLDVLVNNAGVFMEDKELTEDGLEMTWAVNVAAPFLLTAELLGAVSGRIIDVSSISLADQIDWDNTQAEKGFERMGHAAYGMSKLAGNMWSYRLAKLLAPRQLPVICVDPGTVSTKLLYAGWGDVSYAALPAEEADDVFWAAADPALGREIGQEVYFVNRKPRRSPRFSYEAEAQERLWRLLEHQTGARFKISKRAA